MLTKIDCILSVLVVFVVFVIFMHLPIITSFVEPRYSFPDDMTDLIQEGKPPKSIQDILDSAGVVKSVIVKVDRCSINKLPESATITALTHIDHDSFVKVDGNHKTTRCLEPIAYSSSTDAYFHNTSLEAVWVLVTN